MQINHLEAALAAETKRRVDSTTTLHDKCRTMVYDMESRLKTQIENDNKYMTDRLNNLENRIKQLEDNPWEGIDQKFPVNTRVKGKVSSITDYGLFVEVAPGVFPLPVHAG